MKEIFPLSDGRLKSVRDTSRTNSDDDHRRNFPSSSPSLSDLASVGIDNHPPPLRDGCVSFVLSVASEVQSVIAFAIGT